MMPTHRIVALAVSAGPASLHFSRGIEARHSLLPPSRGATRVFFFGSRFVDRDGVKGRDVCADVFDCCG